MLPFSETAAARIRFLLHSAADSDPQAVLRELCGFAEHGYEGSILLMQGCLDQIDYHGAVLNVAVEPHAISAIFRFLLGRPNFCSVFSGALRTMWDNDLFLANLSKALKLSTCERIAVGLACSESFEFRARGQSFCIAEIEELCASHGESFPSELIQEILMFLSQSEGLHKYIDPFVKMLSLLREDFPFVLTPMISEDFAEEGSPRQLEKHSECFISDFDNILSEMETDMSVADIMVELGYGCTVDTLHCKEMLSLFLPLTERTISRILTAMMQTLTGFTDTQTTYNTFSAVLSISQSADSSHASSWNIGVLVDTILQLAPETNWESVIKSLDHEGFYIPDEEAFSFLMSVYSIACKDLFPLNAICGSLWENVDGQISFLRHAVTASSDVFTFAHAARKLPYVESLQPPNAKDNQAWFCLDLLEILCQLAERGYAVLVREIIDSPLRQLPEILLLGISHCHTAYNLLQQEIASTVFPELLKNPSVNVIRHIWDANSSLVLREFVDALTVNPDCILRILDLCEELKILVTVLDSAPFSASIKLAAIAFEKDLIDLDKWLRESLSLYKDAFYEVCLQFLKNMLPDVATDSSSDSFQRSASVNVSQRSLSVIFKVLQSHLGLVRSQKISEEMRRLSSQLSVGLQNAGAMEMPGGDGSTDDVETEANAYFHQMFSGQLGIDSMVQMLGRFKESADNREQRIFECMISNLFEEYKFFPKYPDKQLKIAAVLFGSLIKNQLVTHLTLGIALRCVLDALRKSVDSKMFLFGAKALEQFIDRLIEWPQYCNHILQISHLRTTHADLVAFIERALARISSSQTEFSGVNNNLIEQQDSSPASMESAELASMGATQPAQQFLQIQQRHQVLDVRNKSSVTSSSQMKTIPPLSGQASLVPIPSDTTQFQKAPTLQSSQASQISTSGQAATSSSPGFLRPSRASTPAGMLRQSPYSTGFGAALNIETLVAAAERRDAPIEAPASEIQDKIFFMINNISSANMEAKAKEFIEVLKEQHYPWFAQYMVMKRASIEPNFHDLYLKFLDKVNSRSLNKEIVKATYENCKVLLRSDLIKSSSEERSLLKNLGSWLGKFTIGRNQALRAREIDPKLLIIEAYEKGLMIAVIPFTSKILEPCQCSLAYQPPNPWTMAILGLLVEIYNLPNLKMNLKFDIEVLFKNLGVDLKDVKPTSLLKDRVREVEGNPDFSNKDISASQTLVISESNAGVLPALSTVELQHQVSGTTHPGVHSNAINQYASSLHMPSNTQGDDDKLGTLSMTERAVSGQGQSQIAPSQSSFSANQILSSSPNFSQHIVVNTKLNALGFQMQLQRIIPMAIERAVREILTPVVQRSVTIASQTTKELAMKDYAMESDEGRIRNAAHLMVTSLAASLAHVTCKEPLRVALSNQLRSYIQALSVSGDLLEQAVQLVTNDNLDLACALIEQAATEKPKVKIPSQMSPVGPRYNQELLQFALVVDLKIQLTANGLQTIDGEIGPSIAFRRKQREASGSAYYDSSTYAQGPFARVPEALRPKPGRLSNLQQRVYEEFVMYPWHNQSSHTPSVMSTPASVSSSGASVSSSLPRISGGGSVQLNSGIYPAPVTGPGFSGANQPSDLISDEMDAVSSQILNVSTSQMPTNDIMQQIQDTSPAISQFPLSSADLLVVEASSMAKEFGAVMPSSTGSSERSGVTITDSVLSTGDVLDKYQIVVQKLEGFISKDASDGDIQGVISEVLEILSKCVNRDEAAMAFAQKAFKCLYDNPSNAARTSAYLRFLASIRDVCKNLVKELTNWVIYLDDERKFNNDIMLGLIRSELLNVAEFGLHLSKIIDGGRNKSATEFSISLIKSLLVQEPGINLSEFHDVIEVLSKLAMRPGSSESLHQLLEVAVTRNNNAVPISNADVVKDTKQGKELKISASRSAMNMDEYTAVESTGVDSPGFADQVVLLFNDWIRINELPVNEALCTHYLSQLQQNGLLKGDDQMDRFFYSLMELAVGHCIASEKPGPLSLQPSQQVQPLSFLAIDIYAKLIVSILKFCSSDQATKVVLFSKILSVIVRCVQKDAEERKSLFNPRPYFRLFINLLLDLTTPDPALDSVQFVVLTYFANSFRALQPLKVPGWSFAWLELISHRNFMPRLLLSNNQKGWPFFQRLLVDLFKFMEPYLRNADLPEPVQFLYKGTLRVLLVLLHDFPEFLCEYHFSFCDVIPPSCIQMRNVILSAFPVNMRLPDPCTPNLKIDLLPEINQPPRILSEIDNALKAKQIKVDIDEYLKTRRQDSSFLVELKQKILLSPHEAAVAGTRYNVPFINSLIIYVGMQTILQQPKLPSPHMPSSQVTLSGADIVAAAVDIYNIFVLDTDSEGRYHFLNAVANQLRYPNNHTHYFSCILLYLFAESNQDAIREQITRVLLERLIVNRPHPWGLLITFIELIKNPRYNFWKQSFIHCAPDIEKLFESVSRSCGASRGIDEGLVSGGLSDGSH